MKENSQEKKEKKVSFNVEEKNKEGLNSILSYLKDKNKESISENIHTKKRSKTFYLPRNFVPTLKPKKSTIIPSSFTLNSEKKYFCSSKEIRLQSSFSEDNDSKSEDSLELLEEEEEKKCSSKCKNYFFLNLDNDNDINNDSGSSEEINKEDKEDVKDKNEENKGLMSIRQQMGKLKSKSMYLKRRKSKEKSLGEIKQNFDYLIGNNTKNDFCLTYIKANSKRDIKELGNDDNHNDKGNQNVYQRKKMSIIAVLERSRSKGEENA